VAISIFKPDLQLVTALAGNLTDEDIAECQLLGCTPMEACIQALDEHQQDISWVAVNKHGPMMMWGIFRDTPPVNNKMYKNAGRIWLLMSNNMSKKEKFIFLRESKAWVEVFNTHFDLIFNIADSRRKGLKKFLLYHKFDIIDLQDDNRMYFVRCVNNEEIIN
jgi:hypothetical protein